MAPQHQPLNPEDEDDVVPDMHAAFGIQRATQKQKEPGWRDLGLVELMNGLGVDGRGAGISSWGQPIVSAGATGTGGERVATTNSNAAGTANGNVSAADTLRARRRVEGSVGARLRG